MPGFARRETVDEDEVQVHHCVSRCVRRAWLCGKDPLTGANHDHRRGWIQDRFAELAAIFAVDLGFFAVLSNHFFHLIVRTRPDLARQWSDTEVARRWWRLFPGRRDARGRAAEPTAGELKVLMHDPARIKELRRRLGSLSWLMRCLNEHIARRANREDEVTGRFWEGRFKNQRLDTLSALLVCALYVDLNLIRAGIAKTPEASRDTSASLRLRAKGRRRSGARRVRDDWLAPLTLREGPHAKKSEPPRSRARASNRGMLPLSAAKYFTLLDWVGRQLVAGKRGAIPANLAPILERQAIASDRWLDAVADFGRMFGRVVGPAQDLQSAAARAGKSWFQGLRRCKEVFG